MAASYMVLGLSGTRLSGPGRLKAENSRERAAEQSAARIHLCSQDVTVSESEPHQPPVRFP